MSTEPEPELRNIEADTFVSVAVGMAAAPFLQAFATHFGNRLAGAVDEGARWAVARFLRRQAEEQVDPSEDVLPRTARVEITLETEHGWRVHLTGDLPVEGLTQLVDFCRVDPPAAIDGSLPYPPFGAIDWTGSCWVACGPSGFLVWDPESQHWTSPPHLVYRPVAD